MNTILNYLRRNKSKCARCNRWKDTRPNMLAPFIGDWCLDCVWRQEAEALKQIGTVLGIRVQGRDDWQDVAELAEEIIERIPKERKNREALWQALNVASVCDVDPSFL